MLLKKTIVVLGLCMVGFGFHRGWFSPSSWDRDARSNEIDLNLMVDTNRKKENDVKRIEKPTVLSNHAIDTEKSDAEQEEAMQRIDTDYTRTSFRA
jgi:hypothetical protein